MVGLQKYSRSSATRIKTILLTVYSSIIFKGFVSLQFLIDEANQEKMKRSLQVP